MYYYIYIMTYFRQVVHWIFIVTYVFCITMSNTLHDFFQLLRRPFSLFVSDFISSRLFSFYLWSY
jgi:hypothetical protein